MKNLQKFILAVTAALVILLAVPHGVTAAPITDDRTVIGESYTLENGRILDGDLNVIGGVVEIQETATVKGNVFVLGGLVTIDGTVKGNLTAIGGTVNLNETAVVEGDLISPVSFINIDPDARILGDQIEEWIIPGINLDQFTGMRPQIFPTRNITVIPILMQIGRALASTLVMVALGAFLLLIMPRPAERMTRALNAAPWHMLGYGALTAFVIFAVGIFLIITICLIPVAILVWMAFGIAVLVGWLGLGYELGKAIASSLFKTTWHPVLSAALGNLLLYLVARGINLIPCVGWFPGFIAALFGLGMVLATLFGTYPYPRTTGKEDDEGQVVLFSGEAVEKAIIPFDDEPVDIAVTPGAQYEEVDILPEVPIETLNLGTRVDNILKDAGLSTISAVLKRLEGGDDALLEISGFGEKSLGDLKESLRQKGYQVPESSDN